MLSVIEITHNGGGGRLVNAAVDTGPVGVGADAPKYPIIICAG